MSPLARSGLWRIENGLAETDPFNLEHEFLSEIVEIAVEWDQLDVSNLQCFERLIRRLQVREEVQRLKIEEKRYKDGDSASLLACEHFSGRARMAGGAIVCPLLLTYVAKKVGEEAELVKQQRKAADAKNNRGKK